MAFVGDRRPATQAGNLTAPDAVAVARLRRAGADVPDAVRSIDDLPDVAHVVRWAIAELLTRARPRSWPDLARDWEHDPLSAWLTAAVTLLGHGLLDGFQRGWRKVYVELLDAGARPILAAILQAGGQAALTAIAARLGERGSRLRL